MRSPRFVPRSGRRTVWCALAIGLCCVLGGGIPLLGSVGTARRVADLGAIPPAGPVPSAGHGVSGQVAPARPRPRARPVRWPLPVRVLIPRLHVDAATTPVAADGSGALAVPEDPRVTGWWNGSARPGEPSGSVVIDGHVDSATRGVGAFFNLQRARPGDQVLVITSSRQARSYRVVARRQYSKSALPAADIFTQAVTPRLILLTCGGAFDTATGNYLDNVVVYAVPA